MKKIYFLTAATALLAACGEAPEKKAEENQKERKEISVKDYPDVRKDSVVDDYFGTQVADPYRWLENDTSAETAKWVKAQNEVTFDYLAQIPYRDQVRERLTELWDYEKAGTPFHHGGYYFQYKNDGVQNQSVLYYQKGLEGEEEVLLDPNKLSDDGTASINGMGFSKDGKYMAFGISRAGSDWVTINVMQLDNKKMLDDKIEYVKFSGISWRKDGFYYSAYEPPKEGSDYSGKNEFHTVYYHKLGTAQSEDKLIFRDEEHPQRNAGAGVTEDENYVYISTSESTHGNAIRLKKMGDDFKVVVDDFETENGLVHHLGDGKFLVMTNYKAPNNMVALMDYQNPAQENWKPFIAEKDYVLRSVQVAGGKIIASYMKDVQSKLEVYDMEGNYQYDIELPGIGIAGFSGDKDENVAFYSFSSYTYPTTIFKYDIEKNTSEVFFAPELDFNPADFVTEQVFYKSKDGTEVPMFITHKKGLKKDGSNPTFLYGYGGFNISITPRFSVRNLVFLEQGGVYAVANLRGGSEYGEDWHKSGWRTNKQNVFDDFISAGEYLISENYTSSDHLAIHGRSNGGLLAGAVMTQRPDLMAVSIPGVGVLDMLRYHKFTIGWAWAGEYMSSEDSLKAFEYLYGYSPLHNVKEGTAYPATMVVTADHDDRVVPAHSFKFISELQAKHGGDDPVLIRIDVDAGHGAGKPTSKTIDEWADVWSFVLWNTKAKVSFGNKTAAE
ncbi:MAG: prolyl oligopeptidase family serine peptidase [Vicingaceae bacterium]